MLSDVGLTERQRWDYAMSIDYAEVANERIDEVVARTKPDGMKFLIDKSPAEIKRKQQQHPGLILGQLATPLTNNANWGGPFAIDNGAYSGLDRQAFFRCLKKHEPHKENCLFVAVPDIVGNARRTVELYYAITAQDDGLKPWTDHWALVAQDGLEDLSIQWNGVRQLFIGGNASTNWKESNACYDIVRTAKALGVHVHVGRVNTPKRYDNFSELGADTCDGSGVSQYDWMIDRIANDVDDPHPKLELSYD